MAECVNKTQNSKTCTCSYPGCPRHGLCCECISFHRENNEVPGCLFPAEAEKTYDRSFRYFAGSTKNLK